MHKCEVVLFLLLLIYCFNNVMNKIETEHKIRKLNTVLIVMCDWVTFSNLVLDWMFYFLPRLFFFFLSDCDLYTQHVAQWEPCLLNGIALMETYISRIISVFSCKWFGGGVVSILFLCLWIIVSFELSGHLVQWVRLWGALLTRYHCQLPFFPACPYPSLQASNFILPPRNATHL